MFNVNKLTRKLNKIVTGVILFLCASLVLNTEVYAISNKFVSKKYGYSSQIKIKSTGGVNAYFGYDKNGNAMKYVCDNDVTLYAKDITFGKKLGNTSLSVYEDVTGTFYFSSNASKLPIGKFKCKYSVYIAYDASSLHLSHTWNRESGMDVTLYNYRLNVLNTGYNVSKPSLSKFYVTDSTSASLTLPQESELNKLENYSLKGYSISSGCKGTLLKPGDKINLVSSAGVSYYFACYEKKSTTTEKFSYTIDGNEGTVNGKDKFSGTCSSSSCQLKTYNSSNGVTKNFEYVRSGYTFKGLDTSSSCSNPLSLDNAKVTKDKTTWYACWENANKATCNALTTKSACEAKSSICTWNETMMCASTPCYRCTPKSVGEPESFAITIDGNGGNVNGKTKYSSNCNGTSCHMKYYKDNGQEKTFTFERSGYIFKGVDTSSKCSNPISNSEAKFTKDKPNWYACWEGKVITITFDGNGGTYNGNSTTTRTCNNVDKCDILSNDLPVFTKTGYKLKGWASNSSCSVYDALGANQHAITDKTVYACWEKVDTSSTNPPATNPPATKPSAPNVKTFNVTFDGNGGKNSDGKSSVIITCQNSCSYFPGVDSFSNNNKTFLGWDTSSSCSNPGYVTSAVTSAKTYYACWKENVSTTPSTPSVTQYTIAFNQSWGTNLICSELGYAGTTGECTKIYDEGTKITLPTTGAYNSYNNNKFMFWTPEFTSSDTVCTDSIKSLYASGKSYTVNSNVIFAACYRETFNDNSRWAMEGASADGNIVPCGTELSITECVIESDGIEYCFYNKVGNKAQSGKIYRNKIVSNSAGAVCNEEVKDVGYKYGTISSIIDVSFECGAKLYITTCNGDICNFTSYQNPNGSVISANGIVNKAYLKDSESSALNDTKNCPKIEVEDNDASNKDDVPEDDVLVTKCSNEVSKNVKSSITKKVCYDKDYDDSEVKSHIIDNNLVVCGAGYVLDKTAIRAVGDEYCNTKYCERNFTIECKQENARGSISLQTITADVGSDGYGNVIVKAKSSNSTIVGYYLSDYYKAPTLKSDWISVSSGNFTVRSTPGSKYIWVKDGNGTISNVATVAVRDSVNLNTTLKVLELKDGNSNNMILSYVKESSNDGYTLLSSGKKSDTLLAQGFNSQVHEYRVNVESPTLTVYATLTSTDSSYVEGYGPRTVNLTYGANTILIKIRNNEGKIRTYTIIANRTDDRSADNTLSSIALSAGEIDFNANKAEYIIKIPASTKAVNVVAQISSDLSKFVSGYEPGAIAITGDTTVKLIKVESQTGSIRTYVLTFVKENTDVILKESLQLSGITIPGINIPFESNVSNYNVTVDYETDVIDLYTYLKHTKSMSIISIKKSANAEYVPTSNLGINLDVGINYIQIKIINAYGEESYYRLTIIRKEYGLEISNDTSLKDLRVLGYNINFDPKRKEYNVKIKSEKSLVITAVPTSNRAEVFIRGNEELTGFSTIRVKVVAENGEYETYSIDIRKDPYNKTIEIAAIVIGCVIILGSGCIIIMKKKYKSSKEYYRE